MSPISARQSLSAALAHAVKHRYEPLPTDMVEGSCPGLVDLAWVVSQRLVSRHLAYLFMLKEELGSWDAVGEVLGEQGQTVRKRFQRQAKKELLGD